MRDTAPYSSLKQSQSLSDTSPPSLGRPLLPLDLLQSSCPRRPPLSQWGKLALLGTVQATVQGEQGHNLAYCDCHWLQISNMVLAFSSAISRYRKDIQLSKQWTSAATPRRVETCTAQSGRINDRLFGKCDLFHWTGLSLVSSVNCCSDLSRLLSFLAQHQAFS